MYSCETKGEDDRELKFNFISSFCSCSSLEQENLSLPATYLSPITLTPRRRQLLFQLMIHFEQVNLFALNLDPSLHLASRSDETFDRRDDIVLGVDGVRDWVRHIERWG